MARRQGAGLVEDDNINVGQAFERAAIANHDTLVKQPPGGNDMHHGYGKAERAGTGDDENRDRNGDRPVRVGNGNYPADESK